MNSFLFFLCISVTYAVRVINATVEVNLDTQGGVYFAYEQVFINRVLNYRDFRLSAGYGKATFDIVDHDITLIHFFPLPEPKIEKSTGPYSPLYRKEIYITIFRGSDRKIPSKCLSVERIRSYVKYVELGMRLWSANQISIYQGDDMYISNCLVIDDSYYVKGDVRNPLLIESNKTKLVPNVGIRWFITDDFPGGWIGLALIGNPWVAVNSRANYWTMSKRGIGNDDDKWNGRVYTLIHEFGHNCGFDHSGTRGVSESGNFYNFDVANNYNDCGSYMANCNSWKHTVTTIQYWQVITENKPEPWQYKDVETGIHKYRIYANDHPYSRYFLGKNESYHRDGDIFDGIPFKYNCLAVRILVNTSFTSKYTGAKDSSGILVLEYKHNPTLESAQDFGIRVLTGSKKLSNVLDANIDKLDGWGDSAIFGYGMDYYPSDFDTGTLRIRLTKIHKAPLKGNLEELVVKEDKRNYDEASYAEVEIECYPNKKYTPPKITPPKGLPTLLFSPSIHNCKKNADESGYSCIRSSTTPSGWYYFVNENNRNKHIPRFYTSKNALIKGRNAVRSYRGNDFTNGKVCYGDDGTKCITITTTAMLYPGVLRKNFQHASVKRSKTHGKNTTVEDLGNANLIYGTYVDVPSGGRVYVTDLFGSEKNLRVVKKVFVELLPELETDGFAEGAVIMKDRNGKVIYYDSFTFYQQENGNRLAFGYDDNNEIELSPAVIPNDKYTTTSMLFSKLLKANDWFIYPILYLNDNDYVLIDFKGIVPGGLVMIVETDMGEYSRDLSALSGLNSVSYKLTFMEIHIATIGWSEIDRIKFNKDVEIQNIRPIYSNKVGNQITSVNAVSDSLNFDGYKYEVNAPKAEDKYIYKRVNVEINGVEYSFDNPTSIINPSKSSSKGLSGGAIFGIIVGVVAVIVIALVVCKMIKSKR